MTGAYPHIYPLQRDGAAMSDHIAPGTPEYAELLREGLLPADALTDEEDNAAAIRREVEHAARTVRSWPESMQRQAGR